MSYAAGYCCTLNKSFNLQWNCIHSFWVQGKLHFRLLLVPVKFSLLLTHLLVLLILGEGWLWSLRFDLSVKTQLTSCNNTTPPSWVQHLEGLWTAEKQCLHNKALLSHQSHQRKCHQACPAGSYLNLDVSWLVLGEVCTVMNLLLLVWERKAVLMLPSSRLFPVFAL